MSVTWRLYRISVNIIVQIPLFGSFRVLVITCVHKGSVIWGLCVCVLSWSLWMCSERFRIRARSPGMGTYHIFIFIRCICVHRTWYVMLASFVRRTYLGPFCRFCPEVGFWLALSLWSVGTCTYMIYDRKTMCANLYVRWCVNAVWR